MLRLNAALAVLLAAACPAPAQQEPLGRIAFGSCADQSRPQPIWEAICGQKPDLFLFLGDNIYGDTEDMAEMRAKYGRLGSLPGYQNLCRECPVMATWDDHDFGVNDGGASYAMRDASQKEFLDFFGVPEDSPRRHRKGVYDARVFGPEGKRVQVIMLDTRYHRSPLKQGRQGYAANEDPEATMLGAEQWVWLEEQLRQPAEIRLIGSSIQVVAEDHPFEKWMNIPAERAKLFDTVRKAKASGVILLSGDRHLGELSVMDGGVGYPVYDLTASGLNQASERWREPEENRHRVATVNVGQHFGQIEIEWQDDPLIRLQLRGEKGEVLFQQPIRLSILQPGVMPVANAGPPETVEGVLTPGQAVRKLNCVCTVRMAVRSAGQTRGGQIIFLNSAPDYRDPDNFTAVLVCEELRGKMENLSRDAYAGKTIQVNGVVRRTRNGPQIEVKDPGQIQVVD